MAATSKIGPGAERRGISIDKLLFLCAFIAFVAVIFVPRFATAAAAVFMLSGLACAALNFRVTLYAVITYRYLLILPAYCIFSTLWSQYPDITFRYSLQLALTLLIALILANLLKSRVLIWCIFYSHVAAFLLCVLIELTSNSGKAWAGFYGSKNGFAALAAVFLLVSLAVQKIPEMRIGRIIALIYMPLSPIFMIKAQSAGAILALAPVVGAVFFFRSIKFMSKKFRIAVVCSLAVASLFVGLILSSDSAAITGGILEYFGKDATLTGRTDLWDFAYHLIAQNPLLGVGYRAFWVVGNPDAEALWAEFLVPSGAGFNFHNTYISNAVDLGYVGVFIQVCILYLALFRGFRLSLQAPSPENIFWFSVVAFTLSRSFSEVTVFGEFTIQSMLPYIAYVKIEQGLRRGRQIHRQRNAASERANSPLVPSSPVGARYP